jgi:DNA-binding transcriptional ArsR family regulator
MVIYSPDPLDQTFAALADPTRRQMLARLAERERLAVGELARPLDMSLPAVLKHVKVLGNAGLIVREKVGRTVYCRLEAGALREASRWLERYEKFWTGRLDALARFVEAEEPQGTEEKQPCPPQQEPQLPARPRASPSGASSGPPSRGSGAPGRTRKR